MSIVAELDFKDNATQYKRFAFLTREYVEDPKSAKEDIAKIPLENFFRLLEMYRYNAFTNNVHRGVLDFDSEMPSYFNKKPVWHEPIKAALETAVSEAYESKEVAIKEMEDVLRQLVRTATLDGPKVQPAKLFLNKFIQALE